MIALTDRWALRPLELFALDEGLKLAVCPENGRWLALDETALRLAASLDGQRTVQEVVDSWAGTVTREQVTDLLSLLLQQGLLVQGRDSAAPVTAGCAAGSPGLGVLNLTRQCNLACTYCYASACQPAAGQHGADHMALETALAIVEQMLALNRPHHKRTTILFHGGEPLLNFDVMAAVVAHYAGQDARDLRFEVQTNATLLTSEHAEWIRANHISVGVSIDGDEQTNDIHRRTRAGLGSFERIVAGISVLRAYGVRVGAIVVLTRDNYREMDALFALFRRLGVRAVSLNPVFYGGRGANNALRLELTGEQLFEAYRAFTQLTLAHNASVATAEQRIEERQTKYLTRNILVGEPSYMCLRTPCGAGRDTVAFDVNGDVYACDVFVPQAQHRLGNIHEQPLATLLAQASGAAARSLSDVPECAVCTWRVMCQGICPAHRATAANATVPHAECDFRRRMIPYLIRLFIAQQGAQFLLDGGLEQVAAP